MGRAQYTTWPRMDKIDYSGFTQPRPQTQWYATLIIRIVSVVNLTFRLKKGRYTSPYASTYLITVVVSVLCQVSSLLSGHTICSCGSSSSIFVFRLDTFSSSIPWSTHDFSRLIVICLGLSLLVLDGRNTIFFMQFFTGTSCRGRWLQVTGFMDPVSSDSHMRGIGQRASLRVLRSFVI